MKKYLKVLGFDEIPSSFEEIKKSYKTLVKKYHPDLNPDNKEECEKKIKEINEAYEFLSKKLEKADFSKLRNTNFENSEFDLFSEIFGRPKYRNFYHKNFSFSDDINGNSEFINPNDILFEEILLSQLNRVFQNFEKRKPGDNRFNDTFTTIRFSFSNKKNNFEPYPYTETNRVNLRLNIPLKNIFNQKEITVKYKFKDNQYETKLKLSKLSHLQDKIKLRNKDHELNIFLNIDDTPYTRIKSDLYLTIKRENIENNKVKVFHDLEEKYLLIKIPDTNGNILKLKGKGMWKDDLHRGDLYLVIE
jgi:DnaJ-class molecular chaperone